MKVKYVKAKRGTMFILTEFGFEQYHVRSKYESNFSQKQKFNKSVPITWIEKGYVQEVTV